MLSEFLVLRLNTVNVNRIAAEGCSGGDAIFRFHRRFWYAVLKSMIVKGIRYSPLLYIGNAIFSTYFAKKQRKNINAPEKCMLLSQGAEPGAGPSFLHSHITDGIIGAEILCVDDKNVAKPETETVPAGVMLQGKEHFLRMPKERIPNDDQMAVINELDRNIVLFASAGTGKTFTVAKRVAKIISTGKSVPERILCLTFTIKAANEMQEDILNYVGEVGRQVDTRTIHSFAYQVLKEESTKNPETYCVPGVCDETDSAEELKSALQICGLAKESAIFRSTTALTNFSSVLKHQREMLQYYSGDEEKDFAEVYRHIRSNDSQMFRKMLLFYDPYTKKETTDSAFEDLMDREVGRFLHTYNETLRQSNLLDFDDLICLVHKLFRNEEARDYWRKRFDYIIVDEMQDTSEVEYDMLKQLFPGNHIMMCGDFFQTIYEWRGSRPEAVLPSYIQEFHAQQHMFSQNYRSTQTLTNASFGYLKKTYPALVGHYCPAEILIGSKECGEKILNVRVKALQDEAGWIYNYLQRNKPDDPTKVCLMARSNSYIEKLYTELAEIGQLRGDGNELRFFTVDKDSKFFRKAVIKDILAFIGILLNPTDAVSLGRIARKYIKGVGQQTIEKIGSGSEAGISLSSFIDPGLFDSGDPYDALMQASKAGNIVVYDTETTGLDLSRDQIIQISAIRIDKKGCILDTMDQMVIPTISISAGAQATHHQTVEDIIARGGIGIEEALKRFSDFVDGAVLVGHNSLRFDRPLLHRQLQECGLPDLNIVAEYDTMIMAKQLYPKSANFKLQTLCERFHIVNDAAHDALGDITATGKVLQEMLKRTILPCCDSRREFLSTYAPKFKKFYDFLRELQTQYLNQNRVPDLFELIIERCRLRTKYPEAENLRAMDDLLYAIRNSDTAQAESFLREFLDDAALSGSQMDLLIRKLHKIPIITIHQSKGCEFDTVILAGADDENFPTYNAKVHNTLEEEKRVFYVGITRAKYKLILTSISTKTNRGGVWNVPQSRFIENIPGEYIDTIFCK